MQSDSENARELLEHQPLDSQIITTREDILYTSSALEVREIEVKCEVCECLRPLLNTHTKNFIYFFESDIQSKAVITTFKCVSCQQFEKTFALLVKKVSSTELSVVKIGEYPKSELPKSKALTKFFRNDREEYNKAVVCMANGYGVAAFAYMRRIVEINIIRLLDQIKEGVVEDSSIAISINELKITSPMSDRIRIANSALPDYLKPDGFNPLGQIYGLLSDGVHSLSDSECLEMAENIQACLEFLISELATHKQNKEDFKKRLATLKK